MAVDFSQSYATGTFNLTTGAVNITYLVGKPNDSGAGIYINLINNVGAIVNPTVETMILYATRPDGTKVYFVGENELDRIRIDFNSSIYEVVGNVSAEIQLIDSNGLKKTSNTFTINATEQVFDASYVKSTDDFRVLKEALDTVTHLEDKFDEVIANATVDSEVINARNGFGTLDGRLDNIESTKANVADVNASLNDIEQDINAQLVDKALKSEIGLLSGLLTTDKTSIVAAINELFNSKADKAQGVWITPTFTNNWANVTNYIVKYRKNSLGLIEIIGRMSSGALGSTAFTLPSGYRPSQEITKAVVCGGGIHGMLIIRTNGEITLITGNNTYASVDCMFGV